MKILHMFFKLILYTIVLCTALLVGKQFPTILNRIFPLNPQYTFEKGSNISEFASFNSSLREGIIAELQTTNVLHEQNLTRIQNTEDIISERMNTSYASPERSPRETVKVLVFSHGRSGSSYTGQLLASARNTFFLFEPSAQLKQIRSPVPYPDLFQGLYSCDRWAYDLVTRGSLLVVKSIPPMKLTVESCTKASVILIKSVSYRFNNSIDWLLRNPDIKVIFLVRDPRGIYASTPSTWPTGKVPVKKRCEILDSDLSWFRRLPPEQARILKYEDIVADPVNTTRSVYEFLNINFIEKDTVDFVENHYSEKEHLGIYLGLSQTRNFSPSHKWTQLPKSEIELVEKHCQGFMESLQYPFQKDLQYEYPKHFG